MNYFIPLFLSVFIVCFDDVKLDQTNPMWFSENFQTLYFQVHLVPEEDSPFHYGRWGRERGTHIYEVDFSDKTYIFTHSELCPCSE